MDALSRHSTCMVRNLNIVNGRPAAADALLPEEHGPSGGQLHERCDGQKHRSEGDEARDASERDPTRAWRRCAPGDAVYAVSCLGSKITGAIASLLRRVGLAANRRTRLPGRVSSMRVHSRRNALASAVAASPGIAGATDRIRPSTKSRSNHPITSAPVLRLRHRLDELLQRPSCPDGADRA